MTQVQSMNWLRSALACLFFMATGSTAAPGGKVSFGVFPQLSVRVLVETYQPLADSLAAAVKQQVDLETAADFYTFHQRAMAGEYDLLLTAPHLAWLAWKEGKYRPILIYQEPARGLVVVRKDSPYKQLSDLRGITLATPDPYAIINIRLERELAKAGLTPGRDVKLTAVGSHTNAATHLSERQSDAAIVGVYPYHRLPREMRDGLRIIAETPPMPSHVFLVHPRISEAQEREIIKVIEQFMQGETGKAFLQKNGYGGVRALKTNELKQVEGDARELKRRFKLQEQAGKAN
jgi:phosphonate transport system substrate-binding protein